VAKGTGLASTVSAAKQSISPLAGRWLLRRFSAKLLCNFVAELRNDVDGILLQSQWRQTRHSLRNPARRIAQFATARFAALAFKVTPRSRLNAALSALSSFSFGGT